MENTYINQQRRTLFKSMGVLSVGALAGAWNLQTLKSKPKVNKREEVFNLIDAKKKSDYVPCGFFVHFGEGYKTGDAAVKRHLEYFEAIDMDFIKVQYEAEFPKVESIKTTANWASMPLYKKDFFEKQLYVVKELVKKGKRHAPVIVTLYSPFMSAGHTVSEAVLTQQMLQDPENVKKGLEIVTESTLLFAKECIKLGVDGFLAATQGGEGFRFQNTNIFADYIKPFDLVVMKEINAACPCNVLHICDYVGDYNDLKPFVDYPGHIVNCSMKVGGNKLKTKELYELFKRPIFGGLEKRGPISQKDPKALEFAVAEALNEAPSRFVLGAECALQGEIDWKQVRKVVDIAHQGKH